MCIYNKLTTDGYTAEWLLPEKFLQVAVMYSGTQAAAEFITSDASTQTADSR